MDETLRSERTRQILTGALGNFHVGALTEFEGSTITIPIEAQLPNGWITVEEVDVSIPPRDVLVAFEKPFEDRKRGIAFRRGCCWGMKTITPEDFLQGSNRAREIRGWKSLRDPFGSFFGPDAGKPGGKK